MVAEKMLPKSLVFALTFASAVVIMAGIKAAEPIVTPFVIAIFVAALNAPIMLWLTHKKVPRGAALALVMTFILLVALLLSGLVGSSLEGFTNNLDFYQSRLEEISGQLIQWLSGRGVQLDIDEAKGLFDLSAAMAFIGTAFNHLLSALANAFLIFLTVAFLLLELDSFGEKFISWLMIRHPHCPISVSFLRRWVGIWLLKRWSVLRRRCLLQSF